MQIGQKVNLLIAAGLISTTLAADETPATRTAELVAQDRQAVKQAELQAALTQNPALANLAQQIVKQVRK